MIKEFEKTEIAAIMKIWLDTNITAHHFIPEKYWVDNYNIVKEQYMPMAKTFVYKDMIIPGLARQQSEAQQHFIVKLMKCIFNT